MKNLLRGLGLLACAAVLLYSGSLLVPYLINSFREQRAYAELSDEVRKTKEVSAALPEAPAKYAESGILCQYDALYQRNHDLAGWLRIEGTKIDYPVMFTHDEPEYYLHRAFDGSSASSGCLFIGEGWSEASSQTMIHGHHMKDGSMFTDLEKYKDEEFAKKHPVVLFDTLTEEGQYEIIAAFYGRVYTEDDQDVFRYYQYDDLSDRDVFEEFIRQVKQAALYDTGVDVTFGDQILTLSTCSYHTNEGRFAVVAKRVGIPNEDA